MVVNCGLKAGVLDYWSIGPSVEYIPFFLPTLKSDGKINKNGVG